MIPLPLAAALAGISGALLLPLEPRHGGVVSIAGRAVMLIPLVLLFSGVFASPSLAAMAVALSIALLARPGDDAFHTECALKVLWVAGAALALSAAGCMLMAGLTSTTAPREQWAVLGLELGPSTLWRTALPLTLIAGLVLLGAAPFHFWPSDVLQGASPALAPLAVVALQVAGAGWLSWRLDGIHACPAAAEQSAHVLESVGAIGFIAGAATLLVQREPERRIGALAGLNGALLLAALAAGQRLWGSSASASPAAIGTWAAHLALAVTGAAILSRFTPAATTETQTAAVLFRRHPWAASAGLYAQLSLAGAPGTPGSLIWFNVARDVVRAAPLWLVVALGIAWLASLATIARHTLAACGVRSSEPPPVSAVPLPARAALWVCGLGLGFDYFASLLKR
jgi:NADH:ubiquinone oxidoreductase subunit 2 (subunit N)